MIQFSALPNQPGINPVGEATVKPSAENSDFIDFASLLNGQVTAGDAGTQVDAAPALPVPTDLAVALATEPAKDAAAPLPPTGKILPLALPGLQDLPEAASNTDPAQPDAATDAAAASTITQPLQIVPKAASIRTPRSAETKADLADAPGDAEPEFSSETEAASETELPETALPTVITANPILPYAVPTAASEQQIPVVAQKALPGAAPSTVAKPAVMQPAAAQPMVAQIAPSVAIQPSNGAEPVENGGTSPATSSAASSDGKPVLAHDMPKATKALSLEQVRFVTPDAAPKVEQTQTPVQPAIATSAMLANAPQAGAVVVANARSNAVDAKPTAADKFKDVAAPAASLTGVSARDGADISPLFGTTAPAAATPATSPATTPTAANADAVNRPQDFATLVDRLIAVRQATNPQDVTVSVAHADFGRVELNFRQEDKGLSVALSSPDPDFSRAVSAALPQQPAIRAGEASNAGGNYTPQQHSARQDGAAGSGAEAFANSRGGASARRQDDNSPRANPSYRQGNSDSGEGRQGIFA